MARVVVSYSHNGSIIDHCSSYCVHVSDVDECTMYWPCHTNAVCTNNEGSYSCKCKDGYTGNGYWCKSHGNYFSLENFCLVTILGS